MSERRELPHDPKRVRKELQNRILDLLPALGIVDQPRNGIVTPLNPCRADRHPGSFVIWVEGEGAGAWEDYAIARKGDVYSLIQYLLRLEAWIDAYWWSLDFLNWGRGQVRSSSQAAQDRERAEADRKAAEAKARQAADAKAGDAFKRWLACSPVMPGDPVWTYLTEARGLPMATLKKWPGALRLDPACEHYDAETGEVTEWPAMVSAMSRSTDGKVRAIHRTYLAPDGRGKAPVDKAKKMLGVAEGCAIRVWRGAGDLTPEKAAAAGQRAPLIVTEGIEDALTAAVARPDFRVWAAGSLSLMGTLTWPAAASAVVLVADNDWDKPQAVAAFDKVEAHWRAQAAGRPLKVVRAQAGKDLNDWARGEG
ncbi:MAG: hypothetical protein DI570_09270 [Phenylobacterium zucineum]|nr:MAG: hypothetical protein DI570_09270 [Phenylobacterium zucineum]